MLRILFSRYLFAVIIGALIAVPLGGLVEKGFIALGGSHATWSRNEVTVVVVLTTAVAFCAYLVISAILVHREPSTVGKPTPFLRSIHAWKALNLCEVRERRDLRKWISTASKHLDTSQLQKDKVYGSEVLSAFRSGESPESFAGRLQQKH